MSAALPLKVFPPLFNRYAGGDAFGSHVDNAIRQVPGTPHRVRTDLSATLFFVDPDGYDGGELVVEDTYGSHSVKLPAGDMVLYPSTSLHHVTPGDRRRARLLVLLDPEPGPRRRPADAALRHGHGDPAARRATFRIIRRPFNSPASITTCCGSGPSSESARGTFPRFRR